MDNTQKMLNISIPVSFSDVPEGGVGESGFTVDEVERIKAKLAWEAAKEGIEYWTGKYHIDGKKIYGMKINYGALPNNTSKTAAHNIVNIDKFVAFRGISCNSDGRTQPVPWVSASLSISVSIVLYMTSIIITTNTNQSSYIDTLITLEYTCTDR